MYYKKIVNGTISCYHSQYSNLFYLFTNCKCIQFLQKEANSAALCVSKCNLSFVSASFFNSALNSFKSGMFFVEHYDKERQLYFFRLWQFYSKLMLFFHSAFCLFEVMFVYL